MLHGCSDTRKSTFTGRVVLSDLTESEETVLGSRYINIPPNSASLLDDDPK